MYAETQDGAPLLIKPYNDNRISSTGAWASIVDIVVKKLYENDDDCRDYYMWYDNTINALELYDYLSAHHEELVKEVHADLVTSLNNVTDWFRQVVEAKGKVVMF